MNTVRALTLLQDAPENQSSVCIFSVLLLFFHLHFLHWVCLLCSTAKMTLGKRGTNLGLFYFERSPCTIVYQQTTKSWFNQKHHLSITLTRDHRWHGQFKAQSVITLTFYTHLHLVLNRKQFENKLNIWLDFCQTCLLIRSGFIYLFVVFYICLMTFLF